MLDSQSETLITFGQLAKLLPKGSRPSYVTIWRWWRHGISGTKLETTRVGGRRYTTEAAFRRFTNALSARPPSEAKPSARRQRERDVRNAEKALSDWGI